VRVAMIQAEAGLDKAANITVAVEAIASAAEHQPDLVMLPEAFMHDFGTPETNLAAVAEPLDGPFVGAMAEQARKHQTVVVAGMFETGPDRAHAYNSVVVAGLDGELLTSYRKAHLYDSFGYRESDRLTAGSSDPVTFDAAGFTCGVMTCYDLRFPESARNLIDADAQVLLVPAAWVRGPLKEDHWATLLRARAIENTCYVLAAAQCGRKYTGCSMVVDPMGVVVAALGEESGLVVADVDATRLAAVRRTNPSLLNRLR
jgi:deaminated glutathione amidase